MFTVIPALYAKPNLCYPPLLLHNQIALIKTQQTPL